MLTPRQELILRRVVEGHLEAGQPVGSKWLTGAIDREWGPSTIRNELAQLEELGLLTHPHTSAGRVPTEAGYRYFVDRLLPVVREEAPRMELGLVRREVDEALRVTTEALSQVTDLLAIVSAPPMSTATIRHVEVLRLQPQVLMVVVITSTGGVSKKILTLDRPIDTGLVSWAGSYLNEQLVGMGLGARMLARRLSGEGLAASERAFLLTLAPAFGELAADAEHEIYFDGTSHLVAGDRLGDLSELNELLEMLERRRSLLGVLGAALGEPDVLVRIGAENELPALRSLVLVAARYGLPQRSLGPVTLIGPVRMDYGLAIRSVRSAARELSRFVEEIYAE